MEGMAVSLGDSLPAGAVDPSFWKGRHVLLTGHTGFKGGWLSLWLTRLGAQVTGVSLPPDTTPNLFSLASVAKNTAASTFCDIRDAAALADVVRQAQPEVVLHLAAQPLVRRSFSQPLETFSTNVMGTVNLLESLRGVDSVRVAVVVTTDKVYANREWAWPYREDDLLGGHDPYSASKAACELVTESYRRSFLSKQGIHVASARAGNVIGGGDWSHDRLIPDAIRAWQTGRMLDIRRPDAVRPWQHVLEPVSAYLILAQALWNDSATDGSYNFGPIAHEATHVRRVVELAQRVWGDDATVQWGDGMTGPHEAGLLTLDTARARNELGVVPRWDLEQSVTRTVKWYLGVLGGEDARALCYSDIDAFEAER